MTGTEATSGTRLRAGSIALAVAIVLVPAVVGTKSAEAQTYKEKVLYSFRGKADGRFPYAGLVRDAAGNLYGTTYQGGAYGLGTVFKLSKTGKKTVLHSFARTGGDGANPEAGLVRDAAGNLYGTTPYGGASGYGTVFMLDTTGKETVLYSFTGTGGDGAEPLFGYLVRDAAGNLYGTTEGGGASGYGTVFMLDETGNETVLYSFTGTGGDGTEPAAGLVRDAAGNLYGTTKSGGASGYYGTVFMLDTTGKETVLHSFDGSDGADPLAGLVRDAAGNLYGTTNSGDGYGTVFMLDETGKETVLHSFKRPSREGAYPFGLVRDAKGNLYGTTFEGGASGLGTVFMLDKTGKETVLHRFAGSDGAYPDAGLVRDAKGNLYGTTSIGGAYEDGTMFELTP